MSATLTSCGMLWELECRLCTNILTMCVGPRCTREGLGDGNENGARDGGQRDQAHQQRDQRQELGVRSGT